MEGEGVVYAPEAILDNAIQEDHSQIWAVVVVVVNTGIQEGGRGERGGENGRRKRRVRVRDEKEGREEIGDEGAREAGGKGGRKMREGRK